MLEGLTDSAASNDNAKLGALMIVQQFAATLGQQNCNEFATVLLKQITQDMMFRVKKQLLHTLTELVKHVPTKTKVAVLFPIFTQ